MWTHRRCPATATPDDPPGRNLGRGIRAYVWVASAGVAAHVLIAITGHGSVFHGLLQTPLFVALGLLATLSALRRAFVDRTERVAWVVLATGLGAYSCGSALYFTGGVFISGAFPGVGDLLWLPLFPCIAIAFTVWIRTRLLPITIEHWLDGTIVGLSALAVGATALVPWVLASRTHPDAAFGQLSYPLLELLLLSLLVVSIGLRGWHPTSTQVLIAAALVVLVVTDSIYAHQVGYGSYRPGTVLDSGWPLALTLLGFAAIPAARQRDDDRGGDRIQLVVPLACAVLMVMLLEYPSEGWTLGRAFAALALLVATARLAVSVAIARGAQAQARHYALHDALTGLPNRALFMDRLAHALALYVRERRPVAVLVCNVDGLKAINDMRGQSLGDAVLRNVAQRLVDSVCDGDTVARLGSDEFAVLAEGGSADVDVDEIAARVLRAFQESFSIGGHVITVHVTIGATSLAEGDAPLSDEALLVEADIAMQVAKRQGRNRYQRFEPGMTVPDMDDPVLAAALVRAIDRNEICVVYQPVVDVATGAVHGYEALARWGGPDGAVRPDVFIPLAERLGLARQLGAQVLATAIGDVGRWNRRFNAGDCHVSVNLSPAQLTDPQLPIFITRLFDDHGVKPSQLVLEITERGLLTDSPVALTVSHRLHLLGVGFAIDDFGVGYSSLAHLHQFPIDFVKIDKSFVAGVASDLRKVDFLRGVVQLARELHVRTVAEGIETPQQLRLVREIGCDYAQGYYLGRPGPARAVTFAPTQPVLAVVGGPGGRATQEAGT